MAVFDLEAILKLNDSGFKSGLQQAGSTIAKFGKVAGTAVAAGAAAVAGLATSAVRAYADYEQLAGGVQKLFGDSADTMMQYAQNAYATAGMSANQYMEQSTSFAAALIQSYSGDTAKAADQADKAMRAISDNFNTFGGDISSVQAAFQGFAKQNYTMLDNLKLGYGGTKTEMQRLIADANEYAAATGRAADLSIENFGDIVEAIDLIQEKQGIAGTTAKEAATTISGSVGMMKAAWQNLLVSIADGNADLGKAFSTLTKSAEIAFSNILPVAEQAISGISQLITSVAPMIAEKIPALVSDVLPGLLSAGASIVTALATGLVGALPAIVESIPQILTSIKDAFVEAWPAMKEAGAKLMEMAGEGLKNAGVWLVDAAHSVWTDILGGSEETWQQMKSSTVETWNHIKDSLSNAWDGIKSGAEAFGEGIKSFWAEHGSAITAEFAGTWEMISGKLSGVWDSIVNAATSVFTALQDFWATWGGTIGTVFSSAWDFVKTVFSNSLDVIKAAFDVFAALFSGDWSALWSAVKNLASTVWNGIKSILSSAWNGIKAIASSVWGVISGTISSAWATIKANAAATWGNISATISSVWGNIKSTVSSAIATVKSVISSGFSAAKSTVTSVWSSISSTISSTMANIKAKIQAAIDSIKSIVNFSWSLPHLKLPHFSVSGSFSLNPPSVPSFSVAWNRKALTEPFMFTEATLFGAGEAGDEVLYGKSNLMDDIRTASSESNSVLVTKMDAILAVVSKYLPEAAKKQLVLDTGLLVGGIGTQMDNQLGELDGYGERGLCMA